MNSTMFTVKFPAVLTIAGTDPSGGAGIQADLKTFTSLQCHGASVMTALTAQNTTGVRGVHPIPPEFIEQQINAVLEDTSIMAMKTGMLYDSENVRAVVRALSRHYEHDSCPPLVVDPVSVSTSGHTLLNPAAIDVMIDELFPLAALITPNKAEAELLLERVECHFKAIESLGDLVHAAQILTQKLKSKAVLVKGGHIVASLDDVKRIRQQHPEHGYIISGGLLDENMEILAVATNADVARSGLVVDVLYQDSGLATLYIRPRINSTSTHGTGCTLSAAIASYLALGHTLIPAIQLAAEYTQQGIISAFPMGQGYGPLNHMHALSVRPIARPSPTAPYPLTQYLIQNNLDLWKAYVEHPFTRLLGQGALSPVKFVHFMIQDYHYLKYYARAYGLLAAKSHSFPAIESATRTIINIVTEISTHKSFCSQFGVTEKMLEETPETQATMAYGCYLVDVGVQGDATNLLMALLACLLGYGEVGLWLKKQADDKSEAIKLEGNPYRRWIEDYSGEQYQSAVKLGLETIERCAEADPPSAARLEVWRRIWERCTWLEKNFWNSAMAAEE